MRHGMRICFVDACDEAVQIGIREGYEKALRDVAGALGISPDLNHSLWLKDLISPIQNERKRLAELDRDLQQKGDEINERVRQFEIRKAQSSYESYEQLKQDYIELFDAYGEHLRTCSPVLDEIETERRDWEASEKDYLKQIDVLKRIIAFGDNDESENNA